MTNFSDENFCFSIVSQQFSYHKCICLENICNFAHYFKYYIDMIGVNKVILIGNLGKDPEIVLFDKVKKASFPLATTEQYKNHEGIKVDETVWHYIVCWRGLADVADRFLKKSMQVYIEGKLKSRVWEDKEGNKRRTVEVVAENFKILSRNYNQSNTGIAASSETSSIEDFNSDNFSFDSDSRLSNLSQDNIDDNNKTKILPF